MCFYDQKKFTCGDWAWGNFAARCNHEYRMGETCGMRLVHNTEPVGTKCKLCDKIDIKTRRLNTEIGRLQRWIQEGSTLKASMEKSRDQIADLQKEINQLEFERRHKKFSLGK
ncbi:hypothetical protein PABG_12590 [Paracoccidioides brasiliensis Pb03]|uniref:Uncharacterized protein n=3 Tax=Paracoccidioides TaxID=38946 RepID=A0A0A0HSY9_PARBD|nr:uncharacterized protein PADG_12454 [Paracoccidioides brasiliensis Pb18]XP_015702390.1 hypothetical protein PAAG_12508 [Paracoccidioides lutzii Pb01]KGY14526.1 hypothetical protein PABG_12590 [Paracoccidioides brasiliensis Pb03]ODH46197.1 hypothetical protein GX48_07728 [Paracoccidioides brasiliensis]KGM91433.1 hypothetical protein PADG_12454 [Paracoccidioides brasiliensis Pb18]KGQ00813.1 hypothetical protein PAAG_12508 [Paracoccidioides lutzii Pb01]